MANTTGTTFFNSNVLNIVDQTNTINSASGISIQDQLTNISQMVDFTNKQINTNTISAFDAGGTINVISPLAINDPNTGITTMINPNGAYELYVYGTVYASNYNSLCPLRFTVGHEQPYEAMHVAENGHVGIGTDQPKATLHVKGPAIFDGPVQFNGDVVINGTLTVKGKIIHSE